MQEKDERVTLSKYQYAVQEKFRRAVQEFIWDNSKSKYDEKVYAQMIDIIVEEARKVGLMVRALLLQGRGHKFKSCNFHQKRIL